MSLLFLLIYFIIITVVIEIYVILFRLTGLKSEVSRFQVISMMTGTGFTTRESELISGHPIRRKLATFLILFGAFSLAVIISSISSFLAEGLRIRNLLVIGGGVLLLLAALKLSWIQTMLSSLFNKKMKQNVELGDLPIREVFLTSKEDYLLNLHIYKESPLVYKTLNQVITDYDQLEFVVLFIKRGELKIKRNIYARKINEGDQIYIFGDKEVIVEKFKQDITIMKKRLNHGPLVTGSSW
jgi:hypothetical protein